MLQKVKVVYLFFLYLIAGFFSSKAQNLSLPFRNFSTDQGLANSDVYDIVKDKKGYLWLATDNGLSKFDGIRFKNFFVEDGLASNSLTALGSIGDTLYISCYRTGVQQMIRDRFKEKLFLNLSRISFIRTAGKDVYMFKQANVGKEKSGVYINNENLNNHNVLYSSNRSSRRDYFKVNYDSHEIFKNGNFFRKLPIPLFNEVLFGIDETPDGKLLIGSKGKYFIINQDNSFEVATSPLINSFEKIDIILKDHKNRTWFRDLYGKALVEINHKQYSINDLLNIDEGVVIRNIFFDESNNTIWIATGGKGIFCFYNDYLENYSLNQFGLSNKINAIDFDFTNRLWIGIQEGFFYKEGEKILPFKNPQNWLIGQKIQRVDNELILDYGYNSDGHFLDETKFQNQIVFSSFSPLVKIKNDKQITFFNRNFLIFEKKDSKWTNSEKYPLKKEWLNRRTIFTYFHQNDTTWVGSNKGLFFLLWSNDKKKVIEEMPFPKSEILTSTIIDIKIDGEKNVFVLSEKGLSILRNGKLIFEGKSYKGQNILGSTCMEFDAQNRLWLGVKRGLLVFENTKSFLINDKNGLNSSEINTLKYDTVNNQIWIGTNDGLSKINISDFKKHTFSTPKLQILGISTLLGQYFSALGQFKFSNEQNSLRFHLSASDYESPQTVEFQYNLDGKNWIKTDSTLILPAISFGKHSIYFRVKNDNSDWSEKQKLAFEIEPPFYLNWLFWLAMSLVIIGFVYFWFERNRRKQLKQIKLKRQIADLKQQSMASMMNPHFIFNALNSIQYYINTNDLLLVNEYLSKFGKLIRLNLDSAFNNSVNLKSELDFIELYLSLEKLRFSDKFDYKIIVSEALNIEETYLPPMFIQPFIENALIHGILPSNRKGEIIISINKKDSDLIEILIEDNGIGFEASSKLKKSAHTSRSLSIIKQRIESMNDENKVNLIIFEENIAPGKTGGKVLINIKALKIE
jgi:ligand-binding sensor domain-containing protein